MSSVSTVLGWIVLESRGHPQHVREDFGVGKSLEYGNEFGESAFSSLMNRIQLIFVKSILMGVLFLPKEKELESAGPRFEKDPKSYVSSNK